MNMSKVKELLKTYKSLVWPVGIFIVFGMVSACSQWQNRGLRQDRRKQSLSIGQNMQRLKVWPSSQWEVEKERQDAHQSDANKVEFLARQSTERGLLSYEIFPEPKYSSGQIFDNFGREFRKAVDQLIIDVNGGDCPTQADLDKFVKSAEMRRSLNYDFSQLRTIFVARRHSGPAFMPTPRISTVMNSGWITALPNARLRRRQYGIVGTASWPSG